MRTKPEVILDDQDRPQVTVPLADGPEWAGEAVTAIPAEVCAEPTPEPGEARGPCVARAGDYIHLVGPAGMLRGMVIAVNEPQNAFSRITCDCLTLEPHPQWGRWANIPPTAAQDGEAWGWEWVAR